MLGRSGLGEGDLRNTFGLRLYDPRQGNLRIGFEFHRATLSTALRARMQAHFWRMFDACLEDPEKPIAAVPLLDEYERRAVLLAGQGPDPGCPAPDLLTQVHVQVERRHGHTAVVAPERSVAPSMLPRSTCSMQLWSPFLQG